MFAYTTYNMHLIVCLSLYHVYDSFHDLQICSSIKFMFTSHYCLCSTINNPICHALFFNQVILFINSGYHVFIIVYIIPSCHWHDVLEFLANFRGGAPHVLLRVWGLLPSMQVVWSHVQLHIYSNVASRGKRGAE